MDPVFWFFAILVLGLYGTVISVKALNIEALKHNRGDAQRFENELASLRQEVRELRARQNDQILSLDSTLQRQNALLETLARGALGNGATPAPRILSSGAAHRASEASEALPET